MTMADKTLQTKDISVLRITRDGVDSGRDCVAIEEPLEIGLNYYAEEGQVHQTISVTMRNRCVHMPKMIRSISAVVTLSPNACRIFCFAIS